MHLGHLEVDSLEHSAPVAIKLCFSPQDKRTLEKEYRRYSQFNSSKVKGIPLAIGLFTHLEEDGVEGPSALVTAFAGESLHYRKASITPTIQ